MVLSNYFAEMLAKVRQQLLQLHHGTHCIRSWQNVKVSEFKETRRGVYARNEHGFKNGRDIIVPIWCYKGKNTGERFWDDEKGEHVFCCH